MKNSNSNYMFEILDSVSIKIVKKNLTILFFIRYKAQVINEVPGIDKKEKEKLKATYFKYSRLYILYKTYQKSK